MKGCASVLVLAVDISPICKQYCQTLSGLWRLPDGTCQGQSQETEKDERPGGSFLSKIMFNILSRSDQLQSRRFYFGLVCLFAFCLFY